MESNEVLTWRRGKLCLAVLSTCPWCCHVFRVWTHLFLQSRAWLALNLFPHGQYVGRLSSFILYRSLKASLNSSLFSWKSNSSIGMAFNHELAPLSLACSMSCFISNGAFSSTFLIFSFFLSDFSDLSSESKSSSVWPSVFCSSNPLTGYGGHMRGCYSSRWSQLVSGGVFQPWQTQPTITWLQFEYLSEFCRWGICAEKGWYQLVI